MKFEVILKYKYQRNMQIYSWCSNNKIKILFNQITQRKQEKKYFLFEDIRQL